MINKNLVDYINKNLNKGFNHLSIQNTLIKRGYSSKDVYDTINYVKEINSHAFKASETKDTNKKSWIYFGVFLGIIILLLLILLFLNNSKKTIPEDKLSEGTSFNLQENKEVKFNLNEEKHKLTVNSINEDSVEIILQSEPIKFTIKVGETKKIDLNNDGIYDVYVSLISIKDGKPLLFIKKINEKTCIENWTCANWEICSDGNQTRKCTDLNNCKTTKNRPASKQECEVSEKNPPAVNDTTCAEKNGTICNKTSICTTSIINASNSLRCCIGSCIINQSLDNQNECLTAKNCDDGNYSTNDICSGTPKKCLHSPITQCTDGDNYCPTNCNYSMDSDCKQIETDSIRTECGTDIWCYHDKVIETKNYTLCFNINKYWDDVDQGVVGDCIYYIAVNLNNCTLCEHIVKLDIHNLCIKDVC
jgi:hypothetical protein